MLENKTDTEFVIPSENYRFIIAGVVLVVIGFVLMSGGKAESIHEFHYDEIFSSTRITVAPLTCLLGYAIVMFGILKK